MRKCSATAKWRIRRGWTANQRPAKISTDNSSMVRSPKGPSGHGSEAPGRAAVNLAVPATPALEPEVEANN
jgi:hypothetical protein